MKSIKTEREDETYAISKKEKHIRHIVTGI
jgi:hypothetical protein